MPDLNAELVRIKATLTFEYDVPRNLYGKYTELYEIAEIEECEALGKILWAVEEIGLRPTVEVLRIDGDVSA